MPDTSEFVVQTDGFSASYSDVVVFAAFARVRSEGHRIKCEVRQIDAAELSGFALFLEVAGREPAGFNPLNEVLLSSVMINLKRQDAIDRDAVFIAFVSFFQLDGRITVRALGAG